MAETLKADGFVLLGEIHDNSAHHALRAGLVAHLATAKPSAAKPAVGAAVVFEQFSADQQSALEAFAAMPAPRTAADLMGKLAWDKSPWSKMADYAPLFDAAVASGAAIHAGDPGRAAMRQSAREGAGGLSPDEQVRLGLATPLDPALDAASLAEIEGSHCGLLPKSAFPGMAFAQRYRDASLARALISAARGGGAILIAGNGHVRRDRGVPWYLDRLATGRPVLVVTFGEAEAGRADAAYAAPRAPSGQAAADWVVLAPKAERNSDPCEDMRAAFKSMKAPAQGPGNAAPAAPAPSSAPAQ